jgi:5,6,7,8-tetrahydromethanopterin hydro-lyase
MQVGEGFAGEGVNAAHVNTVLGNREGPVATAWATALASPSAGHAPFVVVLQPGLAVQPPTLFVNKAAIAGSRHAELTWGAAQAGIATGVRDAVAQLPVLAAVVREFVLIAAVWVNPEADDAQQVFENNRVAVVEAVRRGVDGRPDTEEIVAAGAAWNPFFPRPG